MLSQRLLHTSGLSRFYPEAPPEFPGLSYPSTNLDQQAFTFLEGEFIYRSQNHLRFPHRLRIHCPEILQPSLGFNERIWLRIAGVSDQEFTKNPRAYVVEGWIIGVHYATDRVVEFSVLGIFDKVLQIIFLNVQTTFVDFTRCPSLVFFSGGLQYWTYMSVEDVERRAKVVQGVDNDLMIWSPTYRTVQSNLMRLRNTPSITIMFIDPAEFISVSRLSLSPLTRSDLIRLSLLKFYAELLQFVEPSLGNITDTASVN